jgi:lipopolysaccharide biosynthesis regulator YciM
MLTLKLKDKKLEHDFYRIVRSRYNGNMDKAIENFIELLEDFEDLVNVEVRKKEPAEHWDDVKKELKL